MLPRQNLTEDGRGLVVFVHGLWLHPDSWLSWAEEFDRNGYDTAVFRWPGDTVTAAAARSAPPADAGFRLSRLMGQLAATTRTLGRPPVLIGHGIGGLLAEFALRSGLAVAAISLAPVPTGAAIASGARLLVRRPVEGPALYGHRSPAIPSRQQFRRYIANTATTPEADMLYERYVIPGRPAPLLRSLLVTRRFRPPVLTAGRQWPRGPLLLVSGGRDLIVGELSVAALHRRYRRTHPELITDYEVFADRAHSLTMDSQWRAVAFYCLDWLTRREL